MMSLKRALLINPPTGRFIREDRCQSPVQGLSSSLRMPIDLGYMASLFEKEGYQCLLRDYPAIDQSSWETFENDLRHFDPHFLIMSVTTPTLLSDLLTCQKAKAIKPSVTTIANGAHFITEDIEI